MDLFSRPLLQWLFVEIFQKVYRNICFFHKLFCNIWQIFPPCTWLKNSSNVSSKMLLLLIKEIWWSWHLFFLSQLDRFILNKSCHFQYFGFESVSIKANKTSMSHITDQESCNKKFMCLQLKKNASSIGFPLIKWWSQVMISTFAIITGWITSIEVPIKAVSNYRGISSRPVLRSSV